LPTGGRAGRRTACLINPIVAPCRRLAGERLDYVAPAASAAEGRVLPPEAAES
jgi:hypothetical protein